LIQTKTDIHLEDRMEIKMVGPVIFVKDIKAACRFYTEVMGQKIEFDFGNIGFRWLSLGTIMPLRLSSSTWSMNNLLTTMTVSCISKPQLDEVCKRLETTGVEIIHPLIEQPWGARSIHFYDLDGHIVELAEPMPTAIKRMLAGGMPVEAVAQKTGMPLEAILAVMKAD
jgi:catechol 2,3-dioxygenase-like lactoylglutathione lyase family enzyme